MIAAAPPAPSVSEEREALLEAILQIEHMQRQLGRMTGTSNTVLERCRAALGVKG
jgi:hypothetical protein